MQAHGPGAYHRELRRALRANAPENHYVKQLDSGQLPVLGPEIQQASTVKIGKILLACDMLALVGAAGRDNSRSLSFVDIKGQ